MKSTGCDANDDVARRDFFAVDQSRFFYYSNAESGQVEIVDAKIGPELDELLLRKAEEFRAAGRRPYSWDRAHVRPIAALSYAVCVAEIVERMQQQGLKPTAMYVSSTGSTGAGVALGKAVLGLASPVQSICPIKWPWDAREDMAEIASSAAALLGLPHRLKGTDIHASEGYIGPGYGAVTPGGREAMDLLATTEGVLLDPVYTAKAMAALERYIGAQESKGCRSHGGICAREICFGVYAIVAS